MLALETWICARPKQPHIMRLTSPNKFACLIIELLYNCCMTWSAIRPGCFPMTWDPGLGSSISVTLHRKSGSENGWIDERMPHLLCTTKKTDFQHIHYWTRVMPTLYNESLAWRIIQAFSNNRHMTACLQKECTGRAYSTSELLRHNPEKRKHRKYSHYVNIDF